MNGYGVTRVHYHNPKAKDYIEAVKVVEFEAFQGRIDLKKEWQWTRKTLLREVEYNRDVYALFDLDELGPHLEMIEVGGERFIRLDKEQLAHDDLNDLPQF